MARTTIRTEDITDGSVANVDVNASAAISQSKLSLDIVNANVNASAAIVQSKLATLSIDTAELADDAVTAAKLADGAYLANRNRIVNGNFDVWQRGTSFAGQTATAYFADRWEVQPAAGCTMTIDRQAFTAGQVDVPYEPSYFLRADITTAGSANAEISQKIEDVRTFAGQTIAVSFYAKSVAGTQTLTCRIHQDFGSGGSTRVTSATSAKVLTSSWQKFTFSLTLGSISGKTIGTSSYTAFNFYWDNSSTSNDVDLAQVQVEAGSTYTPFEYKSFGQELAACERYYSKSYNTDVAPATSGAAGACSSLAIYSSGSQSLGARWVTSMRKVPAVVIYPIGSTNTGYVTRTSDNVEVAATAGDIGMGGFGYLSGSLPNTFPNGVKFHWSADAEL